LEKNLGMWVVNEFVEGGENNIDPLQSTMLLKVASTEFIKKAFQLACRL
jgi:GH35 family endo-1,4-beta-xylanase